MDKREIRKFISNKKRQMQQCEIDDYSKQLTDVFLNLPEYSEAQILFAYISFNQEVRTFDIIKDAASKGKRVAVPRVEGDHLSFRFIDSPDECAQGSLGIQEPGPDNESADLASGRILMLMPGLAFDASGNRVGYGKGLYDRYLADHEETRFRRIALCYDFQLIDAIEADAFDLKAHKIICAPSGRIISL